MPITSDRRPGMAQVRAGIVDYVDFRPRFTSGASGWCAQVPVSALNVGGHCHLRRRYVDPHYTHTAFISDVSSGNSGAGAGSHPRVQRGCARRPGQNPGQRRNRRRGTRAQPTTGHGRPQTNVGHREQVARTGTARPGRATTSTARRTRHPAHRGSRRATHSARQRPTKGTRAGARQVLRAGQETEPKKQNAGTHGLQVARSATCF
jgi:hypothetical protein